ncbi:ribonuclease HI family protein [Candidatus Bathyarchaeota archaeon]|nr:ribonuclease HI family protein [Candidatus Bathyarchaeota archaeon]
MRRTKPVKLNNKENEAREMATLTLYSDGASRGNPGPAAAAFIVLTEDGRIQQKHAKHLGTKTNNQAEYLALIYALESVSGLADNLVCNMDSQLVVRQLNRQYAVKDPALKALWEKVSGLVRTFREVTFIHVLRTDRHVQEVDKLANQALDKARYSLT